MISSSPHGLNVGQRLPRVLKLCALTFSLVLGGLAVGGPAFAVPLTFTWNPSGVGVSPSGPFTADTMKLTEYSNIVIPFNPTPPGSITETGILHIDGFSLGNAPVATPGLNAGLSPINYQLYFTFKATACFCDAPNVGEYHSLEVQLFADVGGHDSFLMNGTVPTVVIGGGDPQLLLATGTLSGVPGGQGQFAGVGPNISEAWISTFIPDLAASAFFITAPNLLQFSNSVTQIDPPCDVSPGCTDIVVDGSPGVAAFPSAVGEPSTLLLFAGGLIGLGFMVKRGRDSLASA